MATYCSSCFSQSEWTLTNSSVEAVWTFCVGGYQVCEKWLKDRKGRELSYDDIQHYRQIVESLGQTIRLMGAIDEAIPAWPVA